MRKPDPAILRCYCSAKKPWMLTPFSFDMDGEPWAAATQGSLLVAIKGASEWKPPEVKKPINFAKLLEVQAQTTETTVEALREFCGIFPPALPYCPLCDNRGREACKECKGSGETECEMCGNVEDCDECGGSGDSGVECPCGHIESEDDDPLGKISGHPFNLIWLGQALHFFAGRCRYGLGTGTGKEEPSLVIVGQDWRIALMACWECPEGTPEFGVATP